MLQDTKNISSTEHFTGLDSQAIRWGSFNVQLLRRIFNEPTISQTYLQKYPPHSAGDAPTYKPFVNTAATRWWLDRNVKTGAAPLEILRDGLSGALTFLKTVQLDIDSTPENSIIDPREVGRSAADAREVFIVHGHDHATRDAVARFVEHVGLVPVILEEQADAGLTVIEKFERDAAKVAAAIVLLTPDDVGGPKVTGASNPRARQNVIFELGYFAGRLGRKRVCAITNGDIEKPSDYTGMIYTPYDESGGWMIRVARNLKEAGLPLDVAKLL
ncbi:MAG: nucleotide-binding protein [Chloroflexi bacterium]|nr:nucleotide-binding protein [Chloroflexota bacterium]